MARNVEIKATVPNLDRVRSAAKTIARVPPQLIEQIDIVGCDSAESLAEILSKMFPIKGRVVKRRELFLVGRTRVHLDEVEREAEDLMQRLGISRDSLVAGAYIDLLEERATIRPSE